MSSRYKSGLGNSIVWGKRVLGPQTMPFAWNHRGAEVRDVSPHLSLRQVQQKTRDSGLVSHTDNAGP